MATVYYSSCPIFLHWFHQHFIKVLYFSESREKVCFSFWFKGMNLESKTKERIEWRESEIKGGDERRQRRHYWNGKSSNLKKASRVIIFEMTRNFKRDFPRWSYEEEAEVPMAVGVMLNTKMAKTCLPALSPSPERNLITLLYRRESEESVSLE